MRLSEKLQSDILRSVDGVKDIAEARETALRHFAFLPASIGESIAESFVRRFLECRESGIAWLITISSIFLREYDGAAFAQEDWKELRDIVSDGSDELDMDTLTYTMDLVLEHKAL
jgi:hypothetical protein